MFACPFEQLHTKTFDGWICRCGKVISFGMEKDEEKNCEHCPARNCPSRK